MVSFFGDGAIDEGVFHESLNFAALKRLPMLFVCENNRYAIHTHQSRRQPHANICQLAAAYGIPSECIERRRVPRAGPGAATPSRSSGPEPRARASSSA